MLHLGNSVWIYGVVIIVVPFYTMVMQQASCKNLVMIIGELGPVEVELIFSSILVISGLVGAGVYETTLGDAFGLGKDSLF